jgi:hypothetical protein
MRSPATFRPDRARRAVVAGAAGALAAGWATRAGAEPLTVGPQRRFARLADALREAGDGDTVLLDPGEHRGETGVVTQRGLVLRGAGAGAVLHADGRAAEGKGTLVVRGDALVENLELRGSRVADGNGAGIRLERGRLQLRRCRFMDNEMGLLTGNEPETVLQLDGCEFGAAPRHEGLLHHLLYVGAIGVLVVDRCRFGGGWRGHLLKSRARTSVLRDSVFDDGPDGEASYEIEFPNGGRNVVVGNRIVQSPATQNATMLSIGAEARGGEGGALLLVGNTFHDGGVRDARFVHIHADRLGTPTEIVARGNVFVGSGRIGLPPGTDRGENRRAASGRPRREA